MLDPPKKKISTQPKKKKKGPMIRIGREIQCLPYAGFFLPLVDFVDHFPEIFQIVGSSMFYSKHSMPPNSFPPKNLCSISTLTLLSPLVIGFGKYLGFGQIKIRTAQGRFRKRTRLAIKV